MSIPFNRVEMISIVYNTMYDWINSKYRTYRQLFIIYIIRYNILIFYNFFINCKKGDIIFAIEQLITIIHPIIMPTFFYIIYLIFLTFSFHSGIFINGELLNLNLEINQKVCELLNSSLGFFFLRCNIFLYNKR